jgi:hypothetical protein
MDSLIIQTNEKTYSLLFSYKFFKLLGQLWNIGEYTEVIACVAKIGEDLEKLSFDSLDKIANIVKCGILAGENPEDATDFDPDEFINFLFQDLGKLREIFEYLGQCMPKNKSEAEKLPAAKPSNRKK